MILFWCDLINARPIVAVIGFSQESYSTAEGDGVLNVTVSVRSGTLGLDLLVFVQPTGSEEDTATGVCSYMRLQLFRHFKFRSR